MKEKELEGKKAEEAGVERYPGRGAREAPSTEVMPEQNHWEGKSAKASGRLSGMRTRGPEALRQNKPLAQEEGHGSPVVLKLGTGSAVQGTFSNIWRQC